MADWLKLMACVAGLVLTCALAGAPMAAAQFQTGADPAVDAGDIPAAVPTTVPGANGTPSATGTPGGGVNDDNGSLDPREDDGPVDDGVAGGSSGGGGTSPRDGSGAGDVTGRANGDALPLRDAQGGNLPFTGLDLALIVLLGLGLLAAGSALRLGDRVRAARRS